MIVNLLELKPEYESFKMLISNITRYFNKYSVGYFDDQGDKIFVQENVNIPPLKNNDAVLKMLMYSSYLPKNHWQNLYSNKNQG